MFEMSSVITSLAWLDKRACCVSDTACFISVSDVVVVLFDENTSLLYV